MVPHFGNVRKHLLAGLAGYDTSIIWLEEVYPVKTIQKRTNANYTAPVRRSVHE